MTQVLIRRTPIELLKGHGLDRKQIKRVTLAVMKAVSESFKERGEVMNNQREITHRSLIGIDEALKLIGDFDFTVREVEHHLPKALRCRLLDIDYQPGARATNRDAVEF